MNKPKKYKAKRLTDGREIEGYYFEMPETTYCFQEDYERNPVKTQHFLVSYHMNDWGLPNMPYLVEIDIDTLEEIQKNDDTD